MKMFDLRAWWALPAVLLMTQAGCFTLTKPFPEKQFYVLDTSRSGDQSPTIAGSVLKVRQFPTVPEFQGRELVYRTHDLQYESDFYHEWFVSPSAMVTQQVQKWMGASGLFRYVLDGSSVVDETHVLEGSVLALYGDYREKRIPKAVMELRIQLVQETPRGTSVTFQHDYHQSIPALDESPVALVNGWNECLQRILIALEDDLRQANGLAKAAPDATGNAVVPGR
jgi:uncharacterized lipoprotein YmbA